jgi:hypothetical protein
MQEKTAVFSGEKNSEANAAFEIFVKGIIEMENSPAELNSASKNIKAISGEISELQLLAGKFKVSNSPLISAQSDITTDSFTTEYQLPEADVTVL